MDIILGLLTPSHGAIIVDGVTLGAEGIRKWQKNISHVSQSVFLTDDNFLNNIAFGSILNSIDKDKIISSAKKSQIHDFIQGHEEEYGHMIGEHGFKLSGGQRQRLGMARALYKERPILVLDEATSALDTETEKKVLQSVRALDSDVTIIMIAHRLSTLKDCDLVIRLEDGYISESGTYEEIILEQGKL